MRAVRWTVLVAAAAAAAWLAFAPRPVPAAQLRADAEDACAASRFDDAVSICERLTAAHPDDAAGWLLLARSRRGAGRPPDEYIPDAERALAARPDDAAARTFLAQAEAARGRLAAAIAHARAAASLAPADPAAWLLVADLEMRKPQPDLARVRDALEQAQAGGADSRDAEILLAEVSIRLNGADGTGAERLSTGAAAALRRALDALDASRAAEKDPLTAGRTRARFLLALGQPEEAFAAADAALARVPADTPPADTAGVRLLRAMALHSRGNRADALRAFAEVLHDRPDAAAASAAAAYLLASDDPAAVRELLPRAAEADVTGGIRAVLASVLLETGDLEGAAVAVAAACAASPSDPFFAEIRGRVREAEGRLPDARATYAEAVRLGDSLVGPRVRLALLVLAETPDADLNPGVVGAAITELENLRARFDDDPLLLAGLGRLHLVRGEVAKARAALEAAAARRPSDADVWIALAEARGRSGDAASADDTADALARARRLRPTDAAISVREARAWIDAGKPDVAAAACGAHLRRRPGAGGALRVRAEAYGRLGMWSLAAEDLRAAGRSGAAVPDDQAALVLALVRSGDAAAANRIVDDARAAGPEEALRLLGRVATLAGDDLGSIARRLDGTEPSLLAIALDFSAATPRGVLDRLRAMQRDRSGDPLVARLFVRALLSSVVPEAKDAAEARAVVASLPGSTGEALSHFVEGKMLLARRRWGDAVMRLRAADAALVDDPYAALALGDALLWNRDLAAGVAAVRRAAALPGADPWLRADAAGQLLHAAAEAVADPAQAETLALEALNLDASRPGAAHAAEALLRARGDFARAADVAEAALASPHLSPDDALRFAIAAIVDCRLDGEFGAAASNAAALPPAARDEVPARIVRGFAELEAGRFDDAERLFAAASEAEPGSVPATIGLVVGALSRGKPDDALARLAQWTSSHPKDRDVALSAAAEMLRLGRTEAAVTVAATCAVTHPSDVAAARMHARALARSGDVAGAVRSLRAFAERASRDDAAEARLAAASLAARHGFDADAALAEARRIAEDASAAFYLRALGRAAEAEILATTGRSLDADNAARAAIALVARTGSPGRPERRVEARARRVLGLEAMRAVPPRRAEALAELSRAVALDPTNAEAADDLARLRAE